MKTIKRIVVGVDYSTYSQQILEYLTELAARTSAEIIAVSVINNRRIKDITTAIRDENVCRMILEKYLTVETKRRISDLDDLINKWVPKQVSTRTIIRRGVPFEEILKVVDEEKADLLIISSKGRTNFQDYMFGTTAEKIFRHSPVSVLSLNLVN